MEREGRVTRGGEGSKERRREDERGEGGVGGEERRGEERAETQGKDVTYLPRNGLCTLKRPCSKDSLFVSRYPSSQT